MQWQAGITTSPRLQETLTRALASIASAGWNPRVFADGEVEGCEAGAMTTIRNPRIGAWPNWWLGLQELYLRSPRADAYVMFQDDLVIAPHCREYLEAIWERLPRAGFLNLFVASGRRRSGYSLEVGGQTRIGIGALAIVFSNDSLRSLLGSTYLLNHRRREKGLENIDGALRRWSVRTKRPEVLHHPSLVQHTGSKIVKTAGGKRTRNSALEHGWRSARAVSHTFVGEEFDARQLLKERMT